jgi:hypothetical protein
VFFWLKFSLATLKIHYRIFNDFLAKILARELFQNEELILSILQLDISEDKNWAKAQRDYE